MARRTYRRTVARVCMCVTAHTGTYRRMPARLISAKSASRLARITACASAQNRALNSKTIIRCLDCLEHLPDQRRSSVEAQNDGQTGGRTLAPAGAKGRTPRSAVRSRERRPVLRFVTNQVCLSKTGQEGEASHEFAAPQTRWCYWRHGFRFLCEAANLTRSPAGATRQCEEASKGV